MSSNRITLTADHLIIEPVGLDKVWSFTRRLRFPLAHVRGASFDPGMREEPKGWRGPGLRIAGKLSGTFHAAGGRQFYNVSGFERAVVVTLGSAERFDKLVLTVDDPQQIVDEINAALSVH